MENTKEKLEEAQYFLLQMKSDMLNYSKFKFNLSAFLSASRSVTFVMQKEMSGNSLFAEWYKKEQDKMSNDELLHYFNSLRTITIHEKTVRPRKEVHISHKDSLTMNDTITMFIVHADGLSDIKQVKDLDKPISKDESNDSEVKHLWYFEDNNDNDLITLCEKYVKKLVDLVDDFKTVTQ